MNTALSPIESEFDTLEQERAYGQWLRDKVGASLEKANDPATPRYSTDQVMQRMGAIVQVAEVRLSKSR